MPVLVTGATGTIGRALVARLLGDGGQVRAYVRHDDPALRAAGAHVAIGAADDVQRLEAALTRVHTLVHLVGGLLPERGMTYDRLNRETTEVAVIAARAAGVRRIVFLSFPGADPASSNEFLAAKGKAEDHITTSGLEHAIFRCAPVLAPGGELERFLARARRGPVFILPGSGKQRWNPIALSDVVEALVAADGREAPVHGTWDLGGPTEMPFDRVVEHVLGRVRTIHSPIVPGMAKVVTDVYAADVLALAKPANESFHL